MATTSNYELQREFFNGASDRPSRPAAGDRSSQ